MKVDLLSVTDEPSAFDLKIGPNEMDLETEGVRVVGEIETIGEVSTNTAKTSAQGSIRATLEIDCTRCLVPVKRELDLVFNVDFVAKEMLPETKETHLEESDLDTDVLEGNQLDLVDLVREQILLNLPETVLCREECKGICPTCGKDLNEGECGCGDEETDPRWSALKDLKGLF